MRFAKVILDSVAKAAGYRFIRDNDFAIRWHYERSAIARALRDLAPTLIVDVGGNQGQFRNDMRDLGFAGPICTFEPIPALCRQMESVDDSQWHIFEMALGAERQVQKFNVMDGKVFSSFLKPSRGDGGLAGNKIASKIDVEVHRLDEVALPGDTRRILLKMDTQGFDLKVFAGATGWLPNIVGIISELSMQPIYHSMASWQDALNTYAAAGYEPAEFVPLSVQNDQVIEFDCVLRKSGAVPAT